MGREDGEGKEIGGGGKLTDPEDGRGLLGKDLEAPLAALEVDEPIEKEKSDDERCWTLGGRSERRRPCELNLALSPLSSPIRKRSSFRSPPTAIILFLASFLSLTIQSSPPSQNPEAMTETQNKVSSGRGRFGGLEAHHLLSSDVIRSPWKLRVEGLKIIL